MRFLTVHQAIGVSLFVMVLLLTGVNNVYAQPDNPGSKDPDERDDRSCGGCEDNTGSGSTVTYPSMSSSLTADKTAVTAGQPVKMTWAVDNGQCYTTGGFGGWAQGASGSYSSKYSTSGSGFYTTNTPGTYNFYYNCYGPGGALTCRESGGKSGDTTCRYANITTSRLATVQVNPVPPPPPACSDLKDNSDPEDTLIDMADPGCTSPGDPDETDPPPPPPIPPSATISGNGCVIPIGAGSCNVSLTWNILNAATPNVRNTTNNVNVLSVAARTNYAYPRQPGTYSFAARDGLSILKTVNNLVVSCAAGSSWVASAARCVSDTAPECSDYVNNDAPEDSLIDYPNDPGCSGPNDNDETDPPIPTPAPAPAPTPAPAPSPSPVPVTNPTIDIDNKLIRQGQDAVVTWDTGGNAGCSLSSNLVSDPYAVTSETVTPSGTATYTITCGSLSDSVTVQVLPFISET